MNADMGIRYCFKLIEKTGHQEFKDEILTMMFIALIIACLGSACLEVESN